MNPDLRDYLARRAIPRCSLRYYRTSLAPNFKASTFRTIHSRPPRPRPSAQRRPDDLYIDLGFAI